MVAQNGSGKLTLLNLIKNRKNEFNTIPQHFDIHYMQQHYEDTELSTIDYVINSDTKRLELLEIEKYLSNTESNNSDYIDLVKKTQDALKYIESSTAFSRASAILTGLQFTEKMKNMLFSELSGCFVLFFRRKNKNKSSISDTRWMENQSSTSNCSF